MKIVIAGGTGFLGRHLASSLAADGHSVAVLSRRGRRAAAAGGAWPTIPWTPDGTLGDWAPQIDGADAVVNLAGESIASRRWTAAHKQRILDSRVLAARSLVAAAMRAASPPSVFLNASAVGYYGFCGDEPLDESAPAGSDFLANVCVQWETEARRAESARRRVVRVRTGLVLDKNEGALPRIARPFMFGVGGRVGSGRQYWPWIHREDWVALVRWALVTPTIDGAINATAPTPVTNADFARTLGRVLRRPAIAPAPAFALRLLLGEMADALLLAGQRAVPAKAERGGFTFRYRRLDDALRAIYAQP
jgi:uncharacterized protein